MVIAASLGPRMWSLSLIGGNSGFSLGFAVGSKLICWQTDLKVAGVFVAIVVKVGVEAANPWPHADRTINPARLIKKSFFMEVPSIMEKLLFQGIFEVIEGGHPGNAMDEISQG